MAHSSGELIFTGSGGYVAGTVVGESTAPFIVVVGILAGSVAETIELLYSPKNHPDFVTKVEAASEEFVRRSKTHLSKISNKALDTLTGVNQSVKPIIIKVTIYKDKAHKVFDYAYQRTLNSKMD